MPNVATPLLVAFANGRVQHDPQRYKDRVEPAFDNNPELRTQLPPQHFDYEHQHRWNEELKSLWWVRESDRAIFETFVKLRVIFINECLGTGKGLSNPELATYLKICQQLGGTPSTRQKIHIPEADQQQDMF